MSVEKLLTNLTDPAVFGRGSLKLTFDLLRKKNPQLALLVRNITSGTPLPKSRLQSDNKDSDCFKVDLDSLQVRSIVENLMKYSQGQNSSAGKLGMEVVAKTLLEEWIALSMQMISELPEKQKP